MQIKLVPVKNYGSIKIKTINYQTHAVILKNVYYVPSIIINLLSVSQMVANGNIGEKHLQNFQW